MDKLFFLVWNNIYIRSKINHYLYQYNLNYFKKITIKKQYNQIHTTNYRSIEFYFDVNPTKDITNEQKMLSSIPWYVKEVEFSNYGFHGPFTLIGSIPSNVTSIKFNKFGDINNQINSSGMHCMRSLEMMLNELQDTQLTSIESLNNDSITCLDIGSYDGTFRNQCLPKSLKTLKCSSTMTVFNIDSLNSNSITCLDFGDCGSLLKFKIDNGRKDCLSLSSLVNLKSLNLGNQYQDKIPISFLPNSLTSLKLPSTYNVSENLKPFSIPSSVTQLSFQSHNFQLTKDNWKPAGKTIKISSKLLPSSLVSLKLSQLNYLKITKSQSAANQLVNFSKISFASNTFNKSQIPVTITKLKLFCKWESVSLTIPNHIKSISIIGKCKIENSNHLTNLQYLSILGSNLLNCYNDNNNIPLKTIKCNGTIYFTERFNNSLRSLSMIYKPDIFNNNIQFPPNLNILELTSTIYDDIHPINTNLLPCSIHTLIISNAKSLILPISNNLKSIYISSSNEQLLNELDLDDNNFHLAKIIKIVDKNNRIFKKLSNKL